eukprot:3611171-Lingulodinium_polyedra.AAC.1
MEPYMLNVWSQIEDLVAYLALAQTPQERAEQLRELDQRHPELAPLVRDKVARLLASWPRRAGSSSSSRATRQ